jgi:hypothetical protein
LVGERFKQICRIKKKNDVAFLVYCDPDDIATKSFPDYPVDLCGIDISGNLLEVKSVNKGKHLYVGSTKKELFSILSNIPNNKAPGVSKITYGLFKHPAPCIVEWLAEFFVNVK